MTFATTAGHCRRLIDNTGWGFWYRAIQGVFACIALALIAFALSKFEPWLWGYIGVAFVRQL